MRFESMPEFFQFRPYFEVIVDLAVKGDSEIAFARQNWLIAMIQINDFQACRAYRENA